MKKLFFVIGILCLSLTTNAQQYAIPFGGNFTSQATGNQLGHVQTAANTFGSVTGNGKWIGRETMIEYELPSNLNAASLIVYDLNGNEIQSYSISGKGNVAFNTSNLQDGAYVYAIIANGETIARQKMIVQ